MTDAKKELFFDSIKTKLGVMLVAFKNDFSLVAIFLPTTNHSNSINSLKLLLNEKKLKYSLRKNDFPYKNFFIDYFSGEKVNLLDLKHELGFFGPTKFQKDVWKVCKKIGYASTKSYSDIALKLDKRCFRSVGVALGKNNLPLLVPCHRVISKKGIGGFSAGGGINMKKTLLALENPDFPKTI